MRYTRPANSLLRHNRSPRRRSPFRDWGSSGAAANDQVYRTIRNLGSVETLVLKNLVHFLPLLLPTTPYDQLLCPKLATLAIDDDQEVSHQELVWVVKAQAESGFPLQRVLLRAEYLGQVADELRRFVRDMEYGEDAKFRC